MARDSTPPRFHSPDTFYGLERIAAHRADVLEHMRGVLDELHRNGFTRVVSGKRFGRDNQDFKLSYNDAALADTFFSDTLDPQTLFSLAQTTAAFRVPCRFLFLNPLSDQARVRAMMLGSADASKSAAEGMQLTDGQRQLVDFSKRWSHLERNSALREDALNRMLPITLRRTLVGLENLTSVVTAIVNSSPTPSTSQQQDTSDGEVRGRLAHMITHLDALLDRDERDPKCTVSVRFTSDLMGLPFYILGPYLYRGTAMPRASAAIKPWCVFKDDTSRPDDMFEQAREAFGQAWSDGLPMLDIATLLKEDIDRARRPLMIAYSENNKWALDQLVRLMREVRRDLDLVAFPLSVTPGDVAKDAVARMLEEAQAGVALMLRDEEVSLVNNRSSGDTDGATRVRSRPNVLHELGLMQGRFGFNRVLIIKEDCTANYEGPSNIHGMIEERIRVDPHSHGFDEKQLHGVLSRFLLQLRI